MKKIHRDLLFRGAAFKLAIPYFTVPVFRLCNAFLSMGKGMHRKKLNCRDAFINSNGRRIRLCIYKSPFVSGKAPYVMWIHGGGYAIGIPEQDEGFVDDLLHCGVNVVVPDYTLSTEAAYPAAIDDCCNSLLWIKENAELLNADLDNIIVGGDSAGAGLTAAVCIRMRRTGQVKIKCQLIIYPMIDDTMTTPSSQNNHMPFWNTKSNYNGWKLYLGDLFGKEDVPSDAAVSRNTDFSSLPPAFTYIGTLDPFLDETKRYVENLSNAGVKTQMHIFEGCYHGFDIVCPKAKPSKEAHELLKAYVREAVKDEDKDPLTV